MSEGSSSEPNSKDSMDVTSTTTDKPSMELRQNYEQSLRNVTPPPMEETNFEQEEKSVARGGVVIPFPYKLHEMLDRVEMDEFSHVVSWQPHGRAFQVHKPDDFVANVMPVYFNQTKFASFQRQLNLYGFRRFTSGRDRGAYYHPCFLRGKRSLCKSMNRKKIKGTRVRKAMEPGSEPDFYEMPPMPSCYSSERKIMDEAPKSSTTKVKSTAAIASKQQQQQQTSSNEKVTPVIHILHPPRPCSTGTIQAEPRHPYLAISSKAPSTPSLMPESLPPQPVTPDGSKSVASMPGVILQPPQQAQDTTSATPTSFAHTGDVVFFEGKPFHYLDHGYGVKNVLHLNQSSSKSSSTDAPFMLPSPATAI